MIFFFCSECREELEAEESIRGTRMKCPACFKEIEVPQASVSVRGGRKGSTETAEPEDDGRSGRRFIIVTLAAGCLLALTVAGVGWTLMKRQQERAERARPKCPTCEGKKVVTCAVCDGRKMQVCAECKGTGKRRNFRDLEEDCYSCTGGTVSCKVCAGKGEYGCSGCGGTGKLDASKGD